MCISGDLRQISSEKGRDRVDFPHAEFDGLNNYDNFTIAKARNFVDFGDVQSSTSLQDIYTKIRIPVRRKCNYKISIPNFAIFVLNNFYISTSIYIIG